MKEKLLQSAKQAMTYAYAPYSNFKVGAALLTHQGHIYTGCNIENSSYSLTCCAERTAIFKAVSSGEKTFKEFVVIADSNGPISPCGACRQVMSEFFDESMPIHLYNLDGESQTTHIGELLPYAFNL